MGGAGARRTPFVIALLGGSLLLGGCGLFDEPEATPPTPKASPSLPEASGLARYYEQDVQWQDCFESECARIEVPLDYDDPDGPSVEIALTRVPATGERVGSLFVNPGGPGGSAVEYAKAADYIVTPAIREHYDIVGVDPRGVATSSPVRCQTDEEIDALIAADGTPDDAAEEQFLIDESSAIGERCAQNADAVYAHMGTADSARDLDVARAVIGEDNLTYLGKSYGSLLGATYAELFPDRVGRMVLDGALPASLDLVTVTREQAESFEVSLRDFVEDCLGKANCPLSGTVDEAVQQLRDWLASLDADPIPGEGRDLNEALASYAVLSYLYFPSYDYPELRSALNSAMKKNDPEPLLTLLDERISRTPDGRFLDNSTDAFYAVTCLDRPFTGTVEDVQRYAQEWPTTAPTFGEGLAWGLLACRDWPATDEAVTTTRAEGSNPIMVVSTTHDPATPYHWGVQMADELENAVLVTRGAFGHTGYYEGSGCVDGAVDAYLLRGELPSEDPLCADG